MARIWIRVSCLLPVVAVLNHLRCQAERWQGARPAWSPLELMITNDGDELVHSTRSYHRACRTILARGRVWFKGDLYEGQDAVAKLCRLAAHHGVILSPTVLPTECCIPRRGFVKTWSYNAETMLMPGRLDEVLRYAAAARVDVLALQGTMLSIEQQWESEHYIVTPSPRSARHLKDGVAIAISK
eukprot:4915873-Pyramimonas_sp.AAC.1